jgi:hypothetical protein
LIITFKLYQVSNLDKNELLNSKPKNETIDLMRVDDDMTTEDIPTSNMNKSCFVAVHIGAGYHSVAKSGAYRQLCESICKDVLDMLMKGGTARKAVASAVALLEVHTHTHIHT